jgi:hypothetical protein
MVMSEQLWRYYSKRIQTGAVAPIWVSILNTKYPPKKRLGFAPISAKPDLTTLQSEQFVQQLLDELQNKQMKGIVMEDNERTTDIKNITEALNARVKDIKVYEQALNTPIPKNLPETSKQEAELLKLGFVFLEMAGRNDTVNAQAFIDAGFPVNFQHPRNKNTILHLACRWNGASNMANMLIDTGKCDYLLSNKAKELPYDIAYRFNRDHSLAKRLYIETEEMTSKKGLGKPDYKYGFKGSPKLPEL